MLPRALASFLAAAGCALPGQESAPGAAAPEITLERIMAEPDWIGHEPENPYWSDDSSRVYYERKQNGSDQRDLWVVDAAGGEPRVVLLEELGLADESSGDYDRERTRKVYSRHGDLFVRELSTGALRQLTRTAAEESEPRFLSDPDRFRFERDGTLLVRELSTGFEEQPADLRFEDEPTPERPEGFLGEQQERLFDAVRADRGDEEERRDYERAAVEADPTHVPRPWYLGADLELVQQALSPDERWLLLVLRPKEDPRDGEDLAEFVTRSGLVETRDVRPNVGAGPRRPVRFSLLDLATHTRYDLSLDSLPAIRSAEDAPAAEPLDDASSPPVLRDVSSWGARWAPDGTRVACMVRSLDNKDRWLFTIEPATRRIEPVHHLHDDAWIGFRFNEWGWARRGEVLWYTSEESGWSQLYAWSRADGTTRRLTHGEFEVDLVGLDPASDTLYFRANVDHPGVHEVHRVSLDGGDVEQLTHLGGRIAYVLSPDSESLLLTSSHPLQPPDLWVQAARPGAEPTRLTRTSSDAFHALPWVEPRLVAIPSRTGARIHARLYATEDDGEAPRPAVLFVHGAGYLQNAHAGWSGYFREFMFHSLLARRGYVVLDMDYRASAGYGRDWRTAIYRAMGEPELDDLEDGIEWLVANAGVDRERVGIYGGSYGGFLTLMALFKRPDAYACGAALRPVTDWAHYNHSYTSNILNTPEEDPDAYRRSSPIEFAEGLEDPLLICHGMVDSNVLVKDSVRLAQRLIELGKREWELALFPVEGHAFDAPSSWLDEYARILELFEEHLR